MERNESDPVFQSALKVAKSFNSYSKFTTGLILKVLIVDTNEIYAFVTQVDSYNLFNTLATFGFYNRTFAADVIKQAKIYECTHAIPFIIIEVNNNANVYLLEYDIPQ